VISFATVKRLAVSDAKAMTWLMFSARGWTGRINFLRGAAVVFILNSLAALVAQRFLVPEAILLACLATIYPAICVAGKRLHALGHSAWLQAPVRVLMATGLILLFLFQHGERSSPVAMATVVAPLLGAVAEIVMFVWLAVAPNQLEVRTPALAEVFD
jgi:uncharacterized membrane protein YhaH (DUF805 family)